MQTSTFTLRDYQLQAKNITVPAMLGGANPLVVMATGLGKTETIIGIVRDLLEARPAARILILADRDHLVENLHERFVRRVPVVARKSGVVKAEKDDFGAQIIFGSVQTLDNETRLNRVLSAGPFTFCFFDEAHRAVTDQAMRVIDSVKAHEQFLSLAGCTATPSRTDGVGLIEAFDTTVPPPHGLTIQWGIDNKWLVLARVLEMAVGLNFKGNVKTRYGDYATSDVAKLFDVDNVLELIVETHIKIDPDLARQGIAFVPSVAMAYRLAEKFTERGIPAEAADGTVSKNDRGEILDRFRSGETRMLCCYPGLWGEGLDLPELSIVHMAFPTKSRARWQQCAGRGLRPADWVGKTDCVIVDYVPNDDNKVVSAGNILLGEKERELVEEQSAAAKEKLGEDESGLVNSWLFDGQFKGVDGDPMQIIVAETSFVRDEKFAWSRISDERLLILGLGPDQNRDNRSVVVRPMDGCGSDCYEVLLVTMPDYQTKRPTTTESIGDGTFEEATSMAREYAEYNANSQLASKKAKWRSDPISEVQERLLGNYRNLSYVKRLDKTIKTKADLATLTKGEASELITNVKTLQAIS